jgi:peptidyl-prolyl cis-trans isomerase B (cyclophilin B)
MSRTLRSSVLCLMVFSMAMGSVTGQTRRQPARKPTTPPPAQVPKGPPRAKPSKVETMPVEDLKKLRAVIETDQGNISIEFFADLAPINVRNFLRLADQGFFNGTEFNRIVPKFVIQGGDSAKWPADSPNRNMIFETPSLKDEFNPTPIKKGMLAMAHGSLPDSATYHFFICLDRYPTLDGKYTVFGQVTEGLDIVDKIAATPVEPNSDKPVTRITVKMIRVVFPQ